MKVFFFFLINIFGLAGNVVGRYVVGVGMNVSLATFTAWTFGLILLWLLELAPEPIRALYERMLARDGTSLKH